MATSRIKTLTFKYFEADNTPNDLNDIKETGIYYAYGATNAPEGWEPFGGLVVFGIGPVLQIFFGYHGDTLAIRKYNHVSNTWGQWKILQPVP